MPATELGTVSEDKRQSYSLKPGDRQATEVPTDWADNAEFSPTMRNRSASERMKFKTELMEKMKKEKKGGDGGYFYDANISQLELPKMNDYTVIWPWYMLRFENDDDEKEFLKERLIVSGVTTVRLCIIFLFFFYLGNEHLEMTGKIKLDKTQRSSRQLLRICGQFVPSFIWLGLTFCGPEVAWGSLFTCCNIYEPYYIYIQSLFTLLFGVAGVVISFIGRDPDHGPQLLYIFVVWVFFRIPFRASSVVCLLIWVFYSLPIIFKIIPAENYWTWGYLGAGNACLMVAAYAAERNIRDEFSIQKAIKYQKSISEGIMENLLPTHIMQKMMKATSDDDDYDAPSVIAEQHDTVSVLFSDIAGFTKYCGSITPQEVIVFLNDLYTTLDKVCEENSVYKVETIGDAYFVSSGCPSRDDDPNYSTGDAVKDAVNLVQCGLGMTSALRQVMLRNRYDHYAVGEKVEAVYKRTWMRAVVQKCEWSQGSEDGLTGEMITIAFDDTSIGTDTHDAGAGMIRKLNMEHHPVGELVLAIDTLTKERVIGTVKDVDKTRVDSYCVKEDNSAKEFWTNQAYLTPRMRIGIHTGKVIAGVVGYKMPRYHLFGDTVNIAETMESSGVKDYVQVSDTTAELIKDFYELEPRDAENQKIIKHETGREITYLIKSTDAGKINALRKSTQSQRDTDTYEKL